MNNTSRKNFIATMLGATVATPLMATTSRECRREPGMPSFKQVKEILKWQIDGYLRKNCHSTNNEYIRNTVTDNINKMIEPFKTLDILSEYKVICDETNNPKSVIDNNELHVKIGLKENGKVEFLVLECVVVLTGGTWKEVIDA